VKLYRSLLFVPGNRPEWMDKAPTYGADALILDLEDAVPAAEKRAARATVRAGIERLSARGVDVVVRVNGVDTGLTGEDIEAIVAPGLVAVMVPKGELAEDIRKIDAWIELFERKAGIPVGTVRIVVLPETARGIRDAYELATAAPRVSNIVGPLSGRVGDVVRAVGFQWTRPGGETLYLESHILLAARAAGVEYPLAGGPMDIEDLAWVRERLVRARQTGFRGTLLIHPKQIPVANEVFAPSAEEIAWHVGLLRAMSAADPRRGATRYDGTMIDRAHVLSSLDLLAQAESFGLDVGEYPRL
jgi:citrate lyase subunit beta/citryl-CoA lyase